MVEQDHDASSAQRDVEYEFFADADAVERSEHATYTRDKFALQRLERMTQRAQDALEGNGASADAGNAADAAAAVEGVTIHGARSANVTTALNSVAPVPHGFKVASRGLGSASPENFLDTIRFYEQQVFSILGVPRSLIAHDLVRAADQDTLRLRLL